MKYMSVRSLPPEKVAQAASFAWELFSDIKNRSYPIYKFIKVKVLF